MTIERFIYLVILLDIWVIKQKYNLSGERILNSGM